MQCSRCKEWKFPASFRRCPRRHRGYDSWCRPCKAEVRRLKRAADPEKARADARRDYNATKQREARLRALERNPQLEADSQMRHRLKHRHSSEFRARIMLTQIRKRAKEAKRDCSIELSWLVERLKNNHCEVTGLPFAPLNGRGKLRSIMAPSVDRIDSTLGYAPDNCKLVLWGYNAAKGCHTHEEVVTIARALVALEDKRTHLLK